MKFLRILMAATAAAVLATGCESFRGDDDSGKTEKSAAAKKKKAERKGKSKRKRDPRDDIFFGLDGGKAKSFSNDNLSEREQNMLNEELKRQDEEMRDLRRRHRDMDSGRSKRKEWVYGFKPLGSDK